MHEPVKEHLEEVLLGGSFAGADEHLSKCAECRNEVAAMKGQSALFRSLQAPREFEPGPAFYAQVMNRIENQAKPSIWSLFGESMFAKRLAYASTMFLVLVGSLLVSYERSDESTFASTRPELILAGEEQPEPVNMDSQTDRDVILVKLATYQGQDFQ